MTRTTPIRRVTIFCRDVEASLRCYRDLLGYVVIEDKRVEGKEIGRMLGLEECAMRILHLRSGDTPDGLIGLYAIQEGRPAELPRPPNLTSIHLGQSVIVVESNHLIEIEAGVKALGLPIVSELKSYVKTKPSAYLQVGTYKELIFLDPDGIAVNVVQFEPLEPQQDASFAAADLPY